MKKIYCKLASLTNRYDEEVIAYGIKLLLFNFVTVFLILLLSSLFYKIKYGLLYILSLAYVRLTIGGYHCKSIINCLLSFTMIFLFIVSIFKISNVIILLKFSGLVFVWLYHIILKHEKKQNLFHVLITFTYILFYFSINGENYYFIFMGLFVAEILYFAEKIKSFIVKEYSN